MNLTKLIVSGFSLLCCSFLFWKSEPEHVQLAIKIRTATIRQLEKAYNLKAGAVGGAMMEKVEKITILLEICKPLSKEEARILLIQCSEQLIKNFNAYLPIRPYLANYPFSAQNVQIHIIMHSQTGKRLYYPHLSSVSTFENNVYFYTTDPENNFQYKTQEEESYEEALCIVKETGVPITLPDLTLRAR